MSSSASPEDRRGDRYDVVVVGASFAGLAFASVAATRGLRVLVLERDASVGGVVRTTGVLFSDVLDVLDVPQRYLLNAVRRMRICPPSGRPIAVGAEAYRFYMADVTGMLRWMAEQAEGHGAEVRCGASFVDATREADGDMRIVFGADSDGADSDGAESAAIPGSPTTRREVRARFLIGADGTHSTVARRLGLDQNTRFLAGAEWLVDGVAIDRETFYLVMDHHLAPGYCLWLAPHGEIAALGVAGHQRTFKPIESLEAAPARFADVADLSTMRVVGRKGGVIPTGGRLRHVYRDDERGRALLLGDAAGLCGAATGGGIYPALIAGRLAAHAVANEVLNGARGAVNAYQRDLSRAGGLGPYLRIENWLRAAMDRVGSNADMDAFYALFATPSGHALLERTLFHTPILGMNRHFFALLRGLIAQQPSLYGSALRALWARMLAAPRSRIAPGDV